MSEMPSPSSSGSLTQTETSTAEEEESRGAGESTNVLHDVFNASPKKLLSSLFEGNRNAFARDEREEEEDEDEAELLFPLRREEGSLSAAELEAGLAFTLVDASAFFSLKVSNS
jgi:hypothetical protein